MLTASNLRILIKGIIRTDKSKEGEYFINPFLVLELSSLHLIF